MDIVAVHNRPHAPVLLEREPLSVNGDFFLSDLELDGSRVPPHAACDDALYLWQVFSSAPSLWVIAHQVIGTMDFLLGRPSCGPVLSIAHGAAFDV